MLDSTITDRSDELKGWVMGYVSGRNALTRDDDENLTTTVFDAPMFIVEIEDFCRQFPLAPIADAVDSVLQPRQAQGRLPRAF